MRRPPLISFLTYNRLGSTTVSLASLLKSHDDFDLYIVDNGSKDATWEYINDTKDPRIRHIQKFKTQIGCAHALNFMLSHRKDDQGWINFENDFRLHDKNFVNNFYEYHKLFPEMGAFSATVYPAQCETIDQLIKKTPERYIERDSKRVYFDTVMGFCTYMPHETMNRIGYYDEIRCLLDIELQTRFKLLKILTGYTLDIHVSHLPQGGHCPTCMAFHEYCGGNGSCVKYYHRIIPKITHELGVQDLINITKKRDAGEVPIKCNSIFSGIPMNDEDKAKSQYVMDLFKIFTERHDAVANGRII
jgi:glycosyltransferase involved in cell wall biosynthesis